MAASLISLSLFSIIFHPPLEGPESCGETESLASAGVQLSEINS